MSVKLKFLAGIMIFLGFAVIAFWVIFILTGSMTNGIYTVENNQYIIFHQIAEFAMAAAALAGGIMLWKGSGKGKHITFLAIGMLLYSSINSSAHAVKNDITLMPVFIFTFIACIAGLFILLKGNK